MAYEVYKHNIFKRTKNWLCSRITTMQISVCRKTIRRGNAKRLIEIMWQQHDCGWLTLPS